MAELLNILDYSLTTSNFVQAASSETVRPKGASMLAFQAVVTVDTPTPKTFLAAAVNTTDDVITITGHGYLTGTKVQISNPGTLPTGISAATDYFVIVVDADTIALASSLVNANAGTKINITAQGAGTNTSTATALAGASVKIEKSLGDSVWTEDVAATNITAAANLYLEASQPLDATNYRLTYAITAGELSSAVRVVGKGIV